MTFSRDKSTPQIIPIQLSLPVGMGSVNCYLLKGHSGCLLIDTGASNARSNLEKALADTGCESDHIKLVILTHGDFDHSGNAAYLHRQYGTPVAMHKSDVGMVERGDMFVNRKQPNWLVRRLLPLATGFGRKERFTPDVLVKDGYDLSRYGVKVKVLSIPGHSLGSIGILTSEGNLFCGDLFENQTGPKLNSIMDDKVAAEASLDKLRAYKIVMVYPGHGEPFEMTGLLGRVISRK
jgi:hydroxyacylglutathione hydrolase